MLFAYSIAAVVCVFIAWFAIVFTGRWPRGLYDFVAGAMRYITYVYAYTYLLTDRYPPFTGNPDEPYPVQLHIGPPKESYNRLKTAFRIILAIPVMIINYAMGIVAEVGALISWFAIVILGRQVKGLHDMTVLGLSYGQRSSAYLGLVTEDWPPFTDANASVGTAPPPAPLSPSGASSGAMGTLTSPEAPAAATPPPPPPPPAD